MGRETAMGWMGRTWDGWEYETSHPPIGLIRPMPDPSDPIRHTIYRSRVSLKNSNFTLPSLDLCLGSTLNYTLSQCC
jgi:hypothetical protein